MVQGGFKYFCPLKSPKFHLSMRIKQLQYIYIYFFQAKHFKCHICHKKLYTGSFLSINLKKRIIISGGGGGVINKSMFF